MYLQQAEEYNSYRFKVARGIKPGGWKLFAAGLIAASLFCKPIHAAAPGTDIHQLSSQLAGYANSAKPPALTSQLKSSSGVY